MRDRRGPLGQVGAIADGAAAILRRRQRDREPRVVIYDRTGHATALPPGAEPRRHLLESAEQLIALASDR